MASQRLKRFGTKVVKGDLYRLSDDEGRGVRVVTNDASSVDIANVVLPLPGYAVQYPENEIGELFRDFLIRENVSFDRSAPTEATAKGSYRSLIAFAQNLEVDFDSIEGNDASASETEQDSAAAFKLKFDLPSGSYATMLLRELMLTTIVR
jgi:tRNA pseudouridine13 synthase